MYLTKGKKRYGFLLEIKDSFYNAIKARSLAIGMIYTTEELIQILEDELRASWQGERVLLSARKRLKDPVLAMALGEDKISKVYAYREFRDQIHRYQLQHQVSGLVWRECCFQGKQVRFCELHNQLIAVPQDKEVLISVKASVLEFWREATGGMKFWRVGKQLESMTAQQVEQLAQRAQWAEVEAARYELYLGLCWGSPEECHYRWAHPKSGCDRIAAAHSELRSHKLIGSW
ncbi:MAG: hypothetical protein SW833_09155 [Cyanobacteriota bacterium]|nr:hypothetical protein [Cyanobacteriota bacterium]